MWNSPFSIPTGGEQLQVADDVLVIDRDAVKLLQQIEGDVRLPLLDRLAELSQIVPQAERPHFVPQFPQRRNDVKLGFPRLDLLLGVSLQAVGRDEVFVHQDQHSKFSHSATR
jgi:hypothetical protein